MNTSLSTFAKCCIATMALNTCFALHAEKAPNFIIFYMDDLGWAQTSVKMMNSEPESVSDFYQTPNLERLAKRGMKFSSGYAPAPTCTPSRVSIQFGQTTARIQYRFVHDVLNYKQRPNGYKDELSIAGMLKAAGKNYITAHFGKGMTQKMKSVGYDVTDEYEPTAPNGNFHGDKIDIKYGKKLPVDDPKRIYSLTRESLKFLDKHAGKRPFYMMVSHYAVHVPHVASPKVQEKWQKKYDELPNKPTDKRDLFNHHRARTPVFAAMIDESDAHLGKILDALEKAGELDNTYIVFTSDNGAEWTPRDEKNRRYNGALTEGKYIPFEGGVRVPFVVAGPGIKGGTQCDIPVIQWDLLSTFHSLSGSQATLPDKVDGGDLSQVWFKGNKAPEVKRKVPGLVFHFPSYYQPPISAIRMGDYKFMRNMNSGEMRLYNVKDDYREKNDLASKMPEKVVQMDKVLREYVEEVSGGTVEDVYQAAIDLFNEFDRREIEAHKGRVDKLKKEKPADFDEKLAKLEEAYQKKLRSNLFKREMIKDQRECPDWHGGAKRLTEKRLGINKSGDINKRR